MDNTIIILITIVISYLISLVASYCYTRRPRIEIVKNKYVTIVYITVRTIIDSELERDYIKLFEFNNENK